jgi:hypothetical protein
MFLTQDPVMGVLSGQSISWNPYAAANPVMYVDPDGRFANRPYKRPNAILSA